jgi:hypothetical protein
MRKTILAALLPLALFGCNRGGTPLFVAGKSSTPGWEVRYNAIIALARRGSEQIKDDRAWETLQEMLDEEQQLRNFKHELPDKREVSDPGAAHVTLITTLQAVGELHRRKPELDLSGLKPAVQKLTQSRNLAVNTEAKRIQQTMNWTN